MRGSNTRPVYVMVMDSTLVYFEIIQLGLHYMVLSTGCVGLVGSNGLFLFLDTMTFYHVLSCSRFCAMLSHPIRLRPTVAHTRNSLMRLQPLTSDRRAPEA